MSDRPEWVLCIERAPSTTWCGRTDVREFMFTGFDHALAEVERQGRLVPCADCLVMIQHKAGEMHSAMRKMRDGRLVQNRA